MEAAILAFPEGHPATQGHFPGNPVIPGAVLLQAVTRAILPSQNAMVREMKFLAIVRPGSDVELTWQPGTDIRFSGHVAGALVFTGVVRPGAP